MSFSTKARLHVCSLGRIGEFVEAHCEVMRVTRSLIFMRSTLMVGDRLVAMASGVWKILERG